MICIHIVQLLIFMDLYDTLTIFIRYNIQAEEYSSSERGEEETLSVDNINLSMVTTETTSTSDSDLNISNCTSNSPRQLG